MDGLEEGSREMALEGIGLGDIGNTGYSSRNHHVPYLNHDVVTKEEASNAAGSGFLLVVFHLYALPEILGDGHLVVPRLAGLVVEDGGGLEG